VRFFILLFQIQVYFSINFRANLNAQNAGNGISGLQISKGVCPPETPLFMLGMFATHVTFSHSYPPEYIISQKGPFSKNAPQGKSLKKTLTNIPKKTIKCLFTY
jgi:hypothetical protein